MKNQANGRLLVPESEVEAFEAKLTDLDSEVGQDSGATPGGSTSITAKDPPDSGGQDRTGADTSPADEDDPGEDDADEASDDFFEGW